VTASVEVEPAATPTSAWRRVARHPSLVIGGAIVLALVAIAILAPWIAPNDPYQQSLVRRLRPAVWHERGSWAFPLGTDAFGRCYLSRLIYGTRISVIVGAGAATLSALIGASLGILAGYHRGRVDRVVSFIVSTRLALPALLLALAILQVAGSGLAIVVLLLGLTHWDRFAVVLRTATLQVRGRDFVMRSRAMGAGDALILRQDVLPNVLGHIVVVFTFEVAQCVLASATLSFLGLGIQAPEPSWGLMMAEGRNWMRTHPLLITGAGLALMAMVLAVNLLGDGLRDLLTPDEHR